MIMKALVYHGPHKRAWEEKKNPILQENTDAIVRISATTICGTDLHILNGDVPEVPEGLTLGHEGVGVVLETGDGVTTFTSGDRVLISCITSCGKCEACRKGMNSHCRSGGWNLGHTIDGTQAEEVRIPWADTSLYKIPESADEESLVLLSDIFPTGFECGVLNGGIKPGDSVAIVGAGPIGLAALLTAKFYSPSEIIMIDTDTNRLDVARKFGATRTVVGRNGNTAGEVMELTGGRGVDVAIEAVGIPSTFDICQAIVAPGGHLANVGVFGTSVELKMQDLWARNVTITTRLVDTVSTPMLLKAVESGKLQPQKLITHHFGLDEIMEAYDTFSHAAKEKALKVILTNT
jgi:alcohol dehydrogenase